MPKDETLARIEVMYQQKKTDWERRFKRSIDAKVSWELHEEAREEVAEKLRTRRKRTCVDISNSGHNSISSSSSSNDNDSSNSERRSKRRQDYKGAHSTGSRFKFATLGHGVEIKKTTLANASSKNKGLFATRVFLENELITEYTGPIITRKEALELRVQGKASHVKGLNYDFCINGDQNPIGGQGIAQFANDATRDGNNNSKFETKFDLSSGETRCFIKALKKLNPGDEVFVGYGTGYWIMDPTTGEKVYDENAHETFAARNETRQRLKDEFQREKEARLLQKKEEAKIKKENELKIRIEEEAARQEEIRRKAAERAEARREEREARKIEKRAEIELARAAEKKQKEQALAKEKVSREARELARQQARRDARRKEAEATRAKKKLAEAEFRQQTRELEVEKEKAKTSQREQITNIYQLARKKWEKQNGRAISSAAAWDLYEAARAQVEQDS